MIGLPRKLRSGDIRESPIELRTSGNVYHASRTRMQAESQLERRRKLTLQQYACRRTSPAGNPSAASGRYSTGSGKGPSLRDTPRRPGARQSGPDPGAHRERPAREIRSVRRTAAQRDAPGTVSYTHLTLPTSDL